MSKRNKHGRSRLLRVGLIILFSAWSQEALVSQVHNKPLVIALDKLTTAPRVQIVLVQNLIRSEVFRKVIFPQETRYDKSRATEYVGYEGLYRIVRMIHADLPVLQVDEIVKVYGEPNYGLDLVKLEHEEGILKSPIVRTYQPGYPIAGNELILFLRAAEIDGKKTWLETAREGVEAEEDIRKILAKSKQ